MSEERVECVAGEVEYECSGCGWRGTKAEHKAMMARPGVIACCPDMKLVEMSNQGLLACPFCGGEPRMEVTTSGYWVVRCGTERGHSAWSVGETRKMAAECWEKRVGMEGMEGMVALRVEDVKCLVAGYVNGLCDDWYGGYDGELVGRVKMALAGARKDGGV